MYIAIRAIVFGFIGFLAAPNVTVAQGIDAFSTAPVTQAPSTPVTKSGRTCIKTASWPEGFDPFAATSEQWENAANQYKKLESNYRQTKLGKSSKSEREMFLDSIKTDPKFSKYNFNDEF